MNKHSPEVVMGFIISVCDCCNIAHNWQWTVVSDTGNVCCPVTGALLVRYKWNDIKNDLAKSVRYMRACDNSEYGWCLECNDSYHPDNFVADDYGTVVCENCAVPLSDFVTVSENCEY